MTSSLELQGVSYQGLSSLCSALFLSLAVRLHRSSAQRCPSAMAPYSSTVSKRVDRDAIPDDASKRPHHVLSSSGTTGHFLNPHPSAGGNRSAEKLWIWYEPLIH